jgi:ornithine decarboxylase
MTERIFRFLGEEQPETPCLVVDLDAVEENFVTLRRSLPLADIFYAVKANPAWEILDRLNRLGSSFDAASLYEIEQCLGLGIDAARISFGNTIKKESHIAAAFDKGIRLFTIDSEAELEKMARAAPGSKIFCRFLTSGDGADWPLSRKFGCDAAMAENLLMRAGQLGIIPYGVSFHVGSQQRDPGQWDAAVKTAAGLFERLATRGVELKSVNIGGGFPAQYRTASPGAEAHSQAIMTAMTAHFGNNLPRIIAEPGRYIPGDAGIIQTEIVLISQKTAESTRRWVYLDIGKFGGLPEVMDEAIQYRIRTPYNGSPTGPVVIAGPTCDEVDVIYDEANYELPLDLKIGDRIEVLSTGAYTSSYCSVGFNGFPPLREYYI